MNQPVLLGKYRDFDMDLSFNTVARVYEVKIKSKTSRTIALGDDVYGNIIRIGNALDKFAESLLSESDRLENAEK